MEAITAPKNKRKKLPDLTPEPLRRNDDSPDPATILFFAGQIEQKKALVKAAQKGLSAVRKRAINAGLVMQELLEVMADAEMEPEKIAAKYARRKLYADALDVPIGKQFTLFERPRNIMSHDELCEHAYQKGFAYGVMGKNPDEQAFPATSEFYTHNQEGWRAGQAKLAEMIKQLDPAPAATMAQEGEAHPEGDDDAA